MSAITATGSSVALCSQFEGATQMVSNNWDTWYIGYISNEVGELS